MADFSHLLPTQFLLYANDSYDSHVVRLILEEKHLQYQLKFVQHRHPEKLADLNPYATLPILITRDLVLYELNTIFEYLEDRHGAYKLLPATPNERAIVRQLAWRIQHDWLSLGRILLTHPDSFDFTQATHAKKTLNDSLITLSPLFARNEFFMSDAFGWCDVLLSTFLWRLPDMGIDLPTQLCKPLFAYQRRIFSRSSFQNTLSYPIGDDDDT